MTSAEFLNPNFLMFSLSELSLFSSPAMLIALSISRLGASQSFTYTAASLLTNAMAFLVWWSSATFGLGTRITGLPMRQN